MVRSAVRVPQEERTRAMRARLLEATVECLVERGFAGTSTTLVSERAGVSRGAQLHHFPTKNDLVVAAVATSPRCAGRSSRPPPAGPAGAPAHPGRPDLLAVHFTSPVFTAALELWVAARTDGALLAAVAPLEQGVGRQTHRLTVEPLGADESRAGVRELVQATLDLVRGLGLANTITDDARRRGRILDQWAGTLDGALAPAVSDLLDGVLADLGAEGDGPGRGRLRPRRGRLARPTPAEGWDVATQVAHLTWTDEVAVRAATDKAAWDAVVLRPWATRSTLRRHRRADRVADPGRLLARWGAAREALPTTLRGYPAGERIPWFGPPMSPASMATARFMETWAHGLDVYAAVGIEPEATDRIRHVAHLGVRTRNFSFATHGLDAPRRSSRCGSRLRLARPGPGDPPRHPSRCAARHATSACSSPSASTAPTPIWRPPVPTRTAGSTSRSASPGPPGAGRAARWRADHRQLLGLLRRPDLGHAREAGGWPPRRPHRRLPGRADDADPRQGPDEGPLAGLRPHLRPAGRGLPGPGPREGGADRQQRRRAQPRRSRRSGARGGPGLGLDPAVAHVEGDDGRSPMGWTPGALTANAYLGGFGIAAALRGGADVVVTGRVTDASLVVGPAAWCHGWSPVSYDELAGATVAGHVLECGCQATGGNFSGFRT